MPWLANPENALDSANFPVSMLVLGLRLILSVYEANRVIGESVSRARHCNCHLEIADLGSRNSSFGIARVLTLVEFSAPNELRVIS